MVGNKDFKEYKKMLYEYLFDAQNGEQEFDFNVKGVRYEECFSNARMDELYNSQGIMLGGCF